MKCYIVDLELDGTPSYKIFEAEDYKGAYEAVMLWLAQTTEVHRSVSFKIYGEHGSPFEVL
jgi:hypothetical protein